jgi:serine/threonine protein kinase
MLRKLKKRKHAHLVNLLATFRYKGHFYLIFPYALCNLRQYWESTPIPDFTSDTVLWMLRECKAMASALYTVHESRSTHEPVNPYPAIPPSRTGVGVSHPDDDGRLYGRHGDIKAENILWFPEDKEDSQGLLVIADFGLMAFHTKDTRSEVDAKRINGSPSYEPPELMLHSKISRAFDIWSLGCLYLEFTTWLVCGWVPLQRFPEARGMSGYPSPEFHDDTFFTIIENEHRAEVRQGVIDWILDLHEMARASSFIHDFLDLILKNLLEVNPAERIRMGQLNTELSNMLQRASRDPPYLTEPKPFSPRNLQRHPLSLAAFHQNGDIRPPNTQDGAPLPRRFSRDFDSEASSA